MKQQFNVTGMSCAACSAHVEKAVRALPGLQDVQVNLLAGSMTTEYTEANCPIRRLSKRLLVPDTVHRSKEKLLRSKRVPLITDNRN